MALYEYECEAGHVFDMVVSVADCALPQRCNCGLMAPRVYLTPPMGYVGKEINFDSPIDGRAITSRKAWKEDMARNGCSEYDPGIKQDYQRRIKREEEALDKSVDATVDAMIEKMPARKLEKLEGELRSGLDATIERR